MSNWYESSPDVSFVSKDVHQDVDPGSQKNPSEQSNASVFFVCFGSFSMKTEAKLSTTEQL